MRKGRDYKMNNAELIIKLKKEINESKTKKSQIEGKLQIFTEQLKNEFECDDLDKAKKLVNSLEKQIEKDEKELEEKINVIKELI
jgi:conjugal transfer/entry exclusion protein